jgi:hypothetical protein
MGYKLFRFAYDPTVTGIKEGGCQVEIDEQKYSNLSDYSRIEDFFLSHNYWGNWKEKRYFPEFEFEIHADLLRGAKLTSFVHYSPSFMSCLFLIDEKVEEMFSKFNLPPHRLYKTTFYKGDRPVTSSYKLFCSPLMAYENIVDFKESVFFSGTRILGKKYHKITNLEEFENFPDLLHVETLALNKNFDSSLDIYSGRIGGFQFSDRLAEAIEQSGFTGIRLSENADPQLRIL